MSDSPKSERLVLLTSFHVPGVAEQLAFALETEGIPSFVDNDGMVLAIPWSGTSINGFRVKIRECDAEKALAVIRANPRFHGKPDSENESVDGSCLDCGEQMGDADACPKCGWTFGVEEPEPEEA